MSDVVNIIDNLIFPLHYIVLEQSFSTFSKHCDQNCQPQSNDVSRHRCIDTVLQPLTLRSTRFVLGSLSEQTKVVNIGYSIVNTRVCPPSKKIDVYLFEFSSLLFIPTRPKDCLLYTSMYKKK